MEALDHIVINTLTGIDTAAALFTALGFTLTPLGRHSLGSLNHLMVVEGAYLELVGVPVTGKQRADVLNSALGLNGFVLRSFDADATHAHLAAAGLSPADPVSFSRPVDLGGSMADAKFRTVRVPEDLFPAGRVYVCEHLTPALVWRPEWMTHPNRFTGFDSIGVASTEPAAAAAHYAALCRSERVERTGGWRILAEGIAIDISTGSVPAFTNCGLRFASLDVISANAQALDGVVWEEVACGHGTLRVPALDLTLDCRGTA
ncbi:hypothetical protein P775_16005 [Puniceibacterium antarcticum]|uniref:Glyoxalase-like domain-containing protein n=1 Tax=Puniceibacterium antarcticum TaxID=1206336 RepID=A0A2G8RCB7_9RHOB|nr:VOC family protein [Puniceibacterium antarcticum]PIL19170.1 hypothetical protein P775_16005 [Puniceibacterium antarcticum]